MEITDLETNAEETESESVHQKSLMKRLQWRLLKHRRANQRASNRPWHARTDGKFGAGAMLQEEPWKDRCLGRDVRWTWNATLTLGTKVHSSSYLRKETTTSNGTQGWNRRHELCLGSVDEHSSWRSWSEQLGFPAGCGKRVTEHCGVVSTLQNKRRDCTQSKSWRYRSTNHSWNFCPHQSEK
jgi:hypothetical protein